MTAPELLWTPSPERIERSCLTRYQEWLEQRHGLRFEDYHALWRWSVGELETFWASVVEFFGIRFEVPGHRVVSSLEMPGARWYPGARISYPEHVFRGK